MIRVSLILAFLALTGCGPASSPLASITPKEFNYGSVDALGSVMLQLPPAQDMCPTVDASSVHATLGGRPLTLQNPGGPNGLLSEGKCSPPLWKETEPTPPSERETALVVSDDSQTIRLTFLSLREPPVIVPDTVQLTPGGTLRFQVQSAHVTDYLSQVRFQPTGGTEQHWSAPSVMQVEDGSWVLPVPADVQPGTGTLRFDYQSVIAARCEDGTDCTSPAGTAPAPLLSGVGVVNLTTDPLTVTLSN